MHYSTLFVAALAATPQILAQPVAGGKNSSTIQWTNCTTPVPGACGTLTVPLDYTDASLNRTIELNMMRIDATKKPSKGSILINQGGPGADGVSFMKAYGPLLQVFFGGHYDIIGFDPRGTGKVTLPIDCVPNQLERTRQALLTPLLVNEGDGTLGEAVAWGQLSSENCYQQHSEIVEYMGTASVARDMMQIVDALGEDGLLRYWGQSYGSMLGQTAAAMFPERIDKMVIDGIVNPIDYTELDNVAVGEVALSKWLEACIATKNQSACALYRPDATVASLKKKIVDLVAEVKVKPILMGNNITTDLVGPYQVKYAIEGPLRQMLQLGPISATYLDAILERKAEIYKKVQPFIAVDILAVPGSFGDTVANIRCSDNVFRTNKLSDLEPLLQKSLNASLLYGDIYPTSYAGCAQWKIKAKGRYEGDFKTKTKNPMLIIGSPYDLRTPFVSAQKAHKLFEGSALLQHNGYGHCVLYSPGQCAIKAVQDYFTNGTLPEAGKVCEQDFGVFSGKSIEESFGLPPPALPAAE